MILQLFMKQDGHGQLQMLAAKNFDDIILHGEDDMMRNFIHQFHDMFELGEVVNGPGVLRFYGLNFVQEDNYGITIDSDEKLMAIEIYPLSISRWKNTDTKTIEIERKCFISIIASLVWLGITSSLLCAYRPSYLQQKRDECKIYAMVYQHIAVKMLKRYGT